MNDALTSSGSEQPNRGPDNERLLALEAELVEKVARALYEDDHRRLKNCWSWDDSGLDDEHPGTRRRYLKQARAVAQLIRDAEADALRSAAEVADVWAQTQPVSGAQAALIASVTRFTAAKIAVQIRALDSANAGASGAPSPESLPESNNQSETP